MISSSKNRKGMPIRYIIIIIIIVIMIFFAIFSYTLEEGRKLNVVEALIRDVIVSVERIVGTPFKGIGGWLGDFNELREVQKENDILKESIDKISSIETENIELRKEIEDLKKELNIEYVLTDYEYLNATVVSRNISYWYNTLTIDKGKKDGIDKEMVVINATGLIGKVINATDYSAEVRLVTTSDTNNKISVSITNGTNKLNGLINGYDYDKGTLEVEGISNTEEVAIGDKVYTSGLGGVFPSGILIGTVESISTDEYDLAKIINVTPSANFDDINYVSVLKRKSDS